MERALILLYHNVAERPLSGLEVAPDVLRRQVAHVLAKGARPATLSQALEGRGRRFAVTFDDASSSIIELALPVLREFGVPGTVFVSSSAVGAPGILSESDLCSLAENGWEIGSHCVSHRLLTELDDDALRTELADSRAALERDIGVRCRIVAYPFGAADARVVAAARTAGYTFGCTVFGCCRLARGPLSLPRVGVDGREPMLAFKLRVAAPVRALRLATRR